MKRIAAHGSPAQIVSVTSSAVIMYFACLLAFIAPASAQAAFEAPPVLKASTLLPPEMLSGRLFRVDDEVPTDGLMGRYTLRSSLGTFVVIGRELLKIRIAELPAIQQLEATSKSQVFLDAMGRAAVKPIESASKIVSDPVGTVSSIPSGVSRLFDRVSMGAQKITQAASDPTKSDSQRAEDAMGRVGSATITALGFEQGRRQLAKSLGVDPYTTNPVLAQKLTDIAWVAFSGRLAVNVAVSAFVPASIAISGTSFTHDLVYDTPAADLIVMNKRKMLAMGAMESQAEALLNNRWYSLSVLTALVIELDGLSGVAGKPEVIDLAATAKNEEEARFFTAGVHLLARLNATGTRLSKVAGRGTVIGTTSAGATVVPAPVDYISWTERIGRFAERSDVKARQRSIWLTGKISSLAQRGFTRLGWTLKMSPLP